MNEEKLQEAKKLAQAIAQLKSFNGKVSRLSSGDTKTADAGNSAVLNLAMHKGFQQSAQGNAEKANPLIPYPLNMAQKKATHLSEGGISRDDEKAKKIDMNLSKQDMAWVKMSESKLRA